MSKGYDIIKRFSEDLDFILYSDKDVSKKIRQSFRKSVISHIITDDRFIINNDEVVKGNESQFFKAPVRYDINFNDVALRPYLQMEMTFSKPRLPLLTRDIRSIVAEISGGAAETQITCIPPIETAADKISALTWRVVVRDRNSSKDDPTMVRHLYDLAALKETIFSEKETFIKCAKQSLQHDQNQRGGDVIANMSIADRLEKAFELLTSDAVYRKEYKDFVDAMASGSPEEEILFDDAISALREIIQIVLTFLPKVL